MKRYITLALAVACAIFIYANSLMDGTTSSAMSGFVLKLIQKAMETIGVSPALITPHIVRKLAHFCQYALLGFLTTVTVRLWYGKLKSHIFMILFLGLLVPVSDEFLQLFIAGRTGAVQDIVLDFTGFIAGMMFYMVTGSLLKCCKKLFA